MLCNPTQWHATATGDASGDGSGGVDVFNGACVVEEMKPNNTNKYVEFLPFCWYLFALLELSSFTFFMFLASSVYERMFFTCLKSSGKKKVIVKVIRGNSKEF